MPPLYTIGPFNFIDIVGFPDPVKKQVAIESRPGTNAHALWLTGVRGRPVTVQTWRDAVDFGDAVDTFGNYKDYIGESLNVVWADYVFDYQFDILDVRVSPGNLKRTVLGVGGILGLSQGLIIAEWTIIGNDVPIVT